MAHRERTRGRGYVNLSARVVCVLCPQVLPGSIRGSRGPTGTASPNTENFLAVLAQMFYICSYEPPRKGSPRMAGFTEAVVARGEAHGVRADVCVRGFEPRGIRRRSAVSLACRRRAFAREWRRNALKSLIPGSETEWLRPRQTPRSGDRGRTWPTARATASSAALVAIGSQMAPQRLEIIDSAPRKWHDARPGSSSKRRPLSGCRAACTGAAFRRCRAGADGRSSAPDRRSFPSTARSTRPCAQPQTAR